MVTSDVQTYAQALYESLISMALDQLRKAEPRLMELDSGDPDLAKKIENAFPRGTLPAVKNFAMVMAQEGALEKLPGVITALESYLQHAARIVEAEVTSAVPLLPEQQERIREELRQRYDSELDLRFKVDESLIGGLIIRVGDQVVDNSLRTRLGAIQRNMLVS